MISYLFTPIVGKIGEYLAAPVGRQLGYIIFYNGKINNLRNKLENLESLRNGVQASVVAARRNGEEIRNEVNYWTEKVDGFKLDANQFLDDDVNLNRRCFNGWFPNLMTYHRLGKKAHKKAMVAIELHRDGNFATISIPCPSRGIISVPNFVAFETRNQAATNLMDALRNENINFIGIHGMAGVGKTTLVKEIGKIAKEEKLYDEVVMAVVSQNVNVHKIQSDIGDILGLTITETNVICRANKLNERLKKVQKVLIILDDVWARLNVADIGIPFGDDHKGCKIVITTRRKPVCSVMGNETTEIVHLDVLSEQESWDLFRKNVGDVVDSLMLKDVSKAMVKECHGLPVAIVIVGRAMRGKDLDEWKDTVEELKRSDPRNIEGVDEEVYKCLKWSYDYLKDEEAKSCFLLCSLFPEDHQIKVELLVQYGFGLGLFKNVDTVAQVRRRANAIINNLKDSCLLMEGKSKRHVKMHDVVRDVAISIGSDKYCVRAGLGLKEWPNVESLDQYTGISMIENGIEKLPDVCENTNIQIMLLQGNNITFKGSFFEGKKALRVLDVSNYIRPQPKILLESFCFLTRLRTLVLEGFEIGDASALGRIKMLEILGLRNSFLDRPLIGLGELSDLRSLDITDCEVNSDSSIILPNMFSKLSRLEELYLAGTRTGWRFGSGDELKSLPHLNSLTFSIEDVNSWLPENFVFPDLERFAIYKDRCLGRLEDYKGRDDLPYKVRDDFSYDKYLQIYQSNRSTRWWLNCYKPLLKNTNFLSLVNLEDISNVIPDVGLDLNELKALEVRGCIGLEYLIKTEELSILPNDQNFQQVFFNLESLYLQYLKDFKGICNNVRPSIISLAKLKHVEIHECQKLVGPLFPSDLLLLSHQLEKIRLSRCSNLEKLFDFELHGSRAHEPKFLCNLRVVFIHHCSQLKYIFPHSVAQSLQQLQEITVQYCYALEEIVAKENQQQEDDDEAVDKKIVFKCLKEISLIGLPSLKAFCTGNFPFEWPSLKKVRIEDCPQIETFAAAISTTRSTLNLTSIRQKINLCNLRHVRIRNCCELKYIFHPSVAQSLQQLQVIGVDGCKALEEIVAKENQQQEHDDEAVDKKIVFTCLKQISLISLPSLRAFCTGNFPFEWPSLKSVEIEDCPQIETFAAAISTTQSTPNLKSIKQQINLCNLRNVFIINGHQLKYIFHHSVAQSLQQLEYISVKYCEALEEIVAKENQPQEDDDEAVDKKIVFKCLKEIILQDLPSLKAFCAGSFPFEWPSLKIVWIEDCPQMKTFVAATSTTQSMPNLKSIEVDEVEIFQPGVDFNTAMENHFKEKDVSSDGWRHRLIETGESSTSAILFEVNEDVVLEESEDVNKHKAS